MQPEQPTGGASCYSPTLKRYISIDVSGVLRASTDGSTWEQIFTFEGYKVKSINWYTHSNYFIVIGHYDPFHSSIKISRNGLNWEDQRTNPHIFSIIFEELEVMNMTMEKENKEMKKTIDDLKDTVTESKEMITQMFYAPGMPGFMEAQKDYEDIVIKK